MQRSPVWPGLMFAAVNIVPAESSSVSEMLPAVHELPVLFVVALNTEEDDAVTKRPVATSATGTTVKPSTRLMRRDGRRMMVSFGLRRVPPGCRAGGAGGPAASGRTRATGGEDCIPLRSRPVTEMMA